MMLAVLVFGVGSAICGWANSGAVLIFGRIVQGLGTGGIDLFAELILCDLVPLRKRGTYMARKHAVFATGTTVVTAVSTSGDVGPKLANKLLQLDQDARRAEKRGDRAEARQHLRALRKLVRTKVEGDLREALLAQVRERLAKR